MITNKNLRDYLEFFSNLNTNKQQGKIAPHKAILLLSIIDLVEQGQIQTNKIELTEKLENQFNLNWEKYVENQNVFQPIVGTPYVHLRSEPFWKLIPIKSNGNKDLSSNINSYSTNYLKSQIQYAEIDEELFDLFQHNKNRDIFRNVLISTYIHSQLKTNTMQYYKQLKNFLRQAGTTDLKTKDYLKEYNSLRVKVSFGQGYNAVIPWIAFLRDGQTVQNGIYPVYLYFKNNNKLILAYGISETHSPQFRWPDQNSIKIIDYFKNIGILAKRYGESMVFKTYDVTKNLDVETMEKDLFEITNYYKSLDFNLEPVTSTLPQSPIPFSSIQSEFLKGLSEAKLFFDESQVVRYISSLLTKPFIILTGLSGSGKTKLAQSFAMWLCESESQYCLIPVGADWTNREPLLGFPNALVPQKYVKPDNGVLDLIIKAGEDKDKPYFLILDEMNLSHVERYFADFLSTMESKGRIFLHEGDGNWEGVPPSIMLPKNLFIIGTVNIDETTYMFSPKVLDRANTIEFRITAEELGAFLDNPGNVNLDALEGRGAEFGNSFVKIANEPITSQSKNGEINTSLINFFSQLKISGAEFGYRTASEIQRFAQIVPLLSLEATTQEIFDYAILQKLLPKVHGSRRKLEPVLVELIRLCLEDGVETKNYTTGKMQVDTLYTTKIKYPLSLEKIVRMYNNLVQNGFTSFAEA
jgi:5-methylcytosine-specific restriction protein B